MVAAVIRGDIVEWPGAGDPQREDEFLAAAIAHSVEPLIVWQLRRSRVFDRWPERLREPLAQAAREETLLEIGREGEVRRVVGALTHAGVPCLLIKGAALGYSRYPEPWLRPRHDSDVLIRTQDAAAAGGILTDLGYEQPTALVGEFISQQRCFVKTDRLGVRHVFDVHWKISNRAVFADLLSFEELWARAIAVPALGDCARAPADVHALILACLHPAAHHSNMENLVWCYDIHLLASGLGPAEYDEFATIVRNKKVAAICASGLRRAADRFHTAVPPRTMAELAVRGEASAAYLGGSAWRGDVRLADFKALPSWRSKLQMIREVTLPSADYMLKEYDMSNRVLIPALYVHRLTRGTWRLLRRFAQ